MDGTSLSSSNQELGVMTVSEKALSPQFNNEVLTIPVSNLKPGIYFFVNYDWNPYYKALIGAIKVTKSDISSGKDFIKDFWLVPDEYFREEYGYDF